MFLWAEPYWLTDRRADGFHQIVLLQTLAPAPDGFGIRDLLLFSSPKKD